MQVVSALNFADRVAESEAVTCKGLVMSLSQVKSLYLFTQNIQTIVAVAIEKRHEFDSLNLLI